MYNTALLALVSLSDKNAYTPICDTYTYTWILHAYIYPGCLHLSYVLQVG